MLKEHFKSRYHKNADWFVYQTFPKKILQSQDTITEFLKTLVKLINENHTGQIMYARLVANELSEIQHYRKSLFNWTTQQKN